MVLQWSRKWKWEECTLAQVFEGMIKLSLIYLSPIRSLCTSVWTLLPVVTAMFRLVQLSLFGSVQAASGTLFMYNDHRGSHLKKCWIDCVCVCPHWSTGMLPTWFARNAAQWRVCLRAAGRPVLGDDGWTPSHHHEVVRAHRLLLGLFPHVLVFVITQPRDGLKVRAQLRSHGEPAHKSPLNKRKPTLLVTENENISKNVSLKTNCGVIKVFYALLWWVLLRIITAGLFIILITLSLCDIVNMQAHHSSTITGLSNPVIQLIWLQSIPSYVK